MKKRSLIMYTAVLAALVQFLAAQGLSTSLKNKQLQSDPPPTHLVGSGNREGIVINEIRYDDAGADTENFAELKGPPELSLDGYSLVGVNGSDGSDYVVIDLSGHTIPIDGYFVVGQSAAAYTDLVDAGANWQNGPDNIQLRLDAQVIDAVGYGDFSGAVFAGEGSPAPDCPAGMSLSRFPDGYDTDDNSVDFLVSQSPTPGVENEGYVCGDADGNGIVNISDAVYLISYIFGGGNAPDPLLSGDSDCNQIVNISDAVYLIAYIFGGGAAPCAECP